MRSFRRVRTAALLLALAAPIGLTACGAGGGDADDAPTLDTRPTRHATHKPKPTKTADDPTASASIPETTATSAPPATETTDSGPSPEPPTDKPGGPTSYDEARARIEGDHGGEPTYVPRFSTAKDIVYCLLDDPVIGPACELRTGFIKDDDVCGGDIADGVGRVETYQGEARPVCNTDTIREPGANVVDGEGSVVISDDVECLVESIGVTCVDLGQHTGFFIGPREYHVF
ncbi:hypothetical protein F0U44_18625 [Nocardioides humilatus]|uniref:Uncharacterized protein n=1 Tax=Nocardioides humilatus TaxID=2607660 RepID=A0A5B1L991_9ACTN|nr:hypothetical protein [Nocardioides humilatus]KAA1416340.1 hypothetical protein F0U44_18625 [Nocardioides humilatus]